MKNITPGKWKQDGSYVDAEDGSLIASIHSENSIENEANGRLIAMAPQLLKALIDLTEDILSASGGSDEFRREDAENLIQDARIIIHQATI